MQDQKRHTRQIGAAFAPLPSYRKKQIDKHLARACLHSARVIETKIAPGIILVLSGGPTGALLHKAQSPDSAERVSQLGVGPDSAGLIKMTCTT